MWGNISTTFQIKTFNNCRKISYFWPHLYNQHDDEYEDDDDEYGYRDDDGDYYDDKDEEEYGDDKYGGDDYAPSQ